MKVLSYLAGDKARTKLPLICAMTPPGSLVDLGANLVMSSIYELKLQQTADSLLQTIRPILNPDLWGH